MQPGEHDHRQTGMNARVRRSLALVVTVGALAGCGSRSTDAGNSASDRSGVVASTAATSGAVTGVARVYGGPMMPDGHMAANGSPGQGITVTAVRQGKVVASMMTGADGAFRFSLPSGSYVIRGCVDVAVTVAAGSSTRTDLSCPVP